MAKTVTCYDVDKKLHMDTSEWYALTRLDDLEHTGMHDWRPLIKEAMVDSENTRD